ncbi:HIT family protein [Atopococcus tabaci]|uniref:HIT family protein n=1 Tax=Atopococcus tabaci TaxID=269774 RepID=UPI002409B987|nr:HIT family protein [Atopococcus tabaci]
MENCYYCNKDEKSFLIENELAAGFYDESPSSLGHFLVITKRHVPDFFELTPEEHSAVSELLVQAKKLVDREFQPAAYNIGANCGTAAGQSVRHAHFHLIPRYEGDVQNPKGGIRNILPKQP